jgi:hypothetical protein
MDAAEVLPYSSKLQMIFSCHHLRGRDGTWPTITVAAMVLIGRFAATKSNNCFYLQASEGLKVCLNI